MIDLKAMREDIREEIAQYGDMRVLEILKRIEKARDDHSDINECFTAMRKEIETIRKELG